MPFCQHMKLSFLPVELLIEIFLQSGNQPSLLLVCKYFCAVICSTPSFWGSIFIGKRQCLDGGNDFLKQRLDRGQGCLLKVTVHSAEPAMPAENEMWRRLMEQRNRFESFSLWTNKASLCARILHTILISQGPSALPSLRKLRLQYKHTGGFRYQPFSNPITTQNLLRPASSLFPCLTTLVLPFVETYIPYLAEPLISLGTLILDGSDYLAGQTPRPYQLSRLLAYTPNLHTLWSKHTSMFNSSLPGISDTLPPGPDVPPLVRDSLQPIGLPVLLSRLSRLAITVPGRGAQLCQLINAPQLHDLHLDGTRDDEELGDSVAWLSHLPGEIHEALRTLAQRSPGLRRLAVIGVYLHRAAWEDLLGCGRNPPLFPILEVIAIRSVDAVCWQVHNAIDDELIELYARNRRVPLRRFVYVGCEPQLTASSMHQLVVSTLASKHPETVFELEIDGEFGDDTKSGLNELLSLGIKVTLHVDPPQIKSWWTLDGDSIDPAELASY